MSPNRPDRLGQLLSRRAFISITTSLGLGVAAGLLAACTGQLSNVSQPSPAVQTVEVTRVVEKPVEKVQTVVVTATPAPKSATPVTISFWHGYNPVETKAFDEKIRPAFEQAHANVKIQAQAVPYDDFHKKLLTAIAGGNAPDTIRADIVWVPEFADMGALAQLDSLMEDFASLKNQVYDGPLSTNFWRGHYYGLPLDTNCRALLWNKELYDRASVAGPPKTIDDFKAACEKIKSLGKDIYGYGDGGVYAWAVCPWIWSFGGNLTDPDLTKATGFLNSPETMAAYSFMVDQVKRGIWHPGILGGGFDSGKLYATDHLANALDGPWAPPILKQSYPNKPIHWGLMPAGKGGGISVIGGEDIVLFQQSKSKAEAAEFIRFMLRRETQQTMADVGQMPVLKEFTGSDYMKNHPYFGIFAEQMNSARARPPHPKWPQVEDVLTTTGQLIVRGEKPVGPALDEAAKKIDALLGAKS